MSVSYLYDLFQQKAEYRHKEEKKEKEKEKTLHKENHYQPVE